MERHLKKLTQEDLDEARRKRIKRRKQERERRRIELQRLFEVYWDASYDWLDISEECDEEEAQVEPNISDVIALTEIMMRQEQTKEILDSLDNIASKLEGIDHIIGCRLPER